MSWDKLKTILAITMLSIIANYIARWLESDFLDTYLCGNIILILITLLAINITTMGVIMTKLKEISDEFGGNFSDTVNEMETSMQEQVVLLVLANVGLLLKNSQTIKVALPNHDLIFSIVVTGVFIYAIHILYDTGKAIFQILRFEQDKDKTQTPTA